jgi:hypothetical protein
LTPARSFRDEIARIRSRFVADAQALVRDEQAVREGAIREQDEIRRKWLPVQSELAKERLTTQGEFAQRRAQGEGHLLDARRKIAEADWHHAMAERESARHRNVTYFRYLACIIK